MLRHLSIKGIILKKYKQGEYDDSVTLYSPALGKINAVAKGARKVTSRFCGHLETLNICRFELYRSPYRFTITQVITEKNFKHIRSNFKMTMEALMALEIFQKSTSVEENEEGEKLFLLLEKTLDELEKSENSVLVLENFKLKLLQNLGVLPNISVCSFCQKRWHPNSIIDLRSDSHLICEICKNFEPSLLSQKIDFKIIKLINFLLENKIFNKKILLSKEEIEKLQIFTNLFLYNYINKEIHSQKILGQFEI